MSTNPQIRNSHYLLCSHLQTGELIAASENVSELFGVAAGSLLGSSVEDIFPSDLCARIMSALADRNDSAVPIPKKTFAGVDHKLQLLPNYPDGDYAILEIERRISHRGEHSRITGLVNLSYNLPKSSSVEEVLDALCDRLYRSTDFDRVLAYQLDREGGGRVVSEKQNGKIPSLLGVYFRERDIGPEGMNMYSHNPVLIGHRREESTEIVGELSDTLREWIEFKISARRPYPIVYSFLEQAELGSQIGILIRVGGKPWGFLFLNSLDRIEVDYQTRSFVLLSSRIAGQTLENLITRQSYASRERANDISERLRRQIATSDDLVGGLIGQSTTLLDLIPYSTGAVIALDGDIHTIGSTPTEDRIRKIIKHIRFGWEPDQRVFLTNSLPSIYRPGRKIKDLAAGVLAIPIDNGGDDWIIWFRPEEVHSVTYGSVDNGEKATIHRFTNLEEVRTDNSRPWTLSDQSAALGLQVYIRDVVIKRYAQLRRANSELRDAYEQLESFSYTVSHDLRAPLRGIDGFSEILAEDYGDELPEGAKEILDTIQNNVARMNQFITDILDLSRIGRATMIVNPLDVNQIVDQVIANLTSEDRERTRINVQQNMPAIQGDQRQMQLVFSNLIQNAVKYSSQEDAPSVSIGYSAERKAFFVSDNGIGIPAEHRGRVFSMFTRLVTEDEFEGTGVGLAIVKRIIAKHDGNISIEEAIPRGTTFYFTTNPKIDPV